MDTMICYCFGYTAADIERDVVQNGRSTLLELIDATLKAGQSQCAVKNPKGC